MLQQLNMIRPQIREKLISGTGQQAPAFVLLSRFFKMHILTLCVLFSRFFYCCRMHSTEKG